jgi:signal peptidase II
LASSGGEVKRYFVIALVIVLLDQLTKLWVLGAFEPYEVVTVLPVFNLTLVFNEGAAFSFLADAGGWQRYVFLLISLVMSVVFVVWLTRVKVHEVWLAYGLALLLGGAVGNLIDRIWLGKVIDFLQWYWNEAYFPAFNLADAAITLGVIFLLWDSIKTPTEKR